VKRRQARRRNAASCGSPPKRRTGLRIAEARRLAAVSRRRLLVQEPWETGASRRASRRFTAAFVVIQVRASGAEDRRRAAGRSRDPPPRRRPPGECRPRLETAAVAEREGSSPRSRPVPRVAPWHQFLIARLAMLLAQRSPPAQWRTKGPKGRLSRRRPGVLAGKAAAQGNRPSAPSSAPPDDASRGQKVRTRMRDAREMGISWRAGFCQQARTASRISELASERSESSHEDIPICGGCRLLFTLSPRER
jgi:hypothetical protein